MNRIFLLLALAGWTLAGAAQDMTPEAKHSVVTNSFWSNWFVSGHGTWNAFYLPSAGGPHSTLGSAPFHRFPKGEGYTGWGASLSLGKWFTPGVGLRTKVNAWQTGTKHGAWSPDKYWTAGEHVLLNLTSLVAGYQERRLWELIPYVGAGVARNMTHDQYSTVLSCGLLNTLRLSRRVAVDIEVGWNNYTTDFLRPTGSSRSGLGNSRRAHQLTAEVGLTYRLGCPTWKRTPDGEALRALAQEENDALNAQLADLQAENDRLQQSATAHPAETPAPAAAVAVAAPAAPQLAVPEVSVFFSKGSAVVTDSRQWQNVAALVALAKEHADVCITVTGYADSQTGTEAQNRQLSQRRADAVADELERLGIARERIETIAAGGVDTLPDAGLNRRATIVITK